MSIENTKYLSKMSTDDLKKVYKKWPNPLTPIAILIGGLGYGMYTLHKHSQGEGSFAGLVGAFVVFIVMTLGACIFGFIKLSGAKKVLFAIGDSQSLPRKELLKEFKRNLKHIAKL